MSNGIPNTTKSKLAALVEKYGYQKVADKLGYSYSYIHQSVNLKYFKMGRDLILATRQLYKDTFENPRPPVIRRMIVFPPEYEYLARYMDQLTMEQRIRMVEYHLLVK